MQKTTEMTEKEKLIEFMKRKDEIVWEETGVLLMWKYDYKEIEEEWEEDECKWINKEMATNLMRCDHLFGGDICPWCLKRSLKDRDCNNCGYGKRHKVCDKEGSTWKKIIKKKSINEIIAGEKKEELQRILD